MDRIMKESKCVLKETSIENEIKWNDTEETGCNFLLRNF